MIKRTLDTRSYGHAVVRAAFVLDARATSARTRMNTAKMGGDQDEAAELERVVEALESAAAEIRGLRP